MSIRVGSPITRLLTTYLSLIAWLFGASGFIDRERVLHYFSGGDERQTGTWQSRSEGRSKAQPVGWREVVWLKPANLSRIKVSNAAGADLWWLKRVNSLGITYHPQPSNNSRNISQP